MRGRQAVGACLAVLAIAATFALPMPSLGEIASSAAPQPPAVLETPASRPGVPAAVEAARIALRRGLPRSLRYAGRTWRVERLGSSRAVICESARRCALVARGAERILYLERAGARRAARLAARKGEPR